jgi:DNA-binding NtrC family response regulator
MHPPTGEAALAAIIGHSPAIEELRATVRRLAGSDLLALILGPSGAGKELIACALHAVSGRRGRLVAFNVCAIPESTFESAVFGHVRGGFTGATADHPGYLAEADGGTAFFDEIGGVSPAVQSKLLRAVETHEFRPVGARADHRSDFRLVAATNADLAHLEAQGRFRTDLLHRLYAGVVLCVPPLRERLEDLPLLAQHFARQAAAHLGRDVRLDTDAVARLCDHPWPGNVRQLGAVVLRAAALAQRDPLGPDDVEAAMHAIGANGTPVEPAGSNGASIQPLAMVVRRAEAAAIAAALAQANGDRAAAARMLGISVATLRRRLTTLRRPAVGLAPGGRSILSVRDQF